MFQESCVKGYLWKSLVLTGGSGFVFFLLGRFLCGFSVDISGITAVSAGLICLWLYGGLSLKRLCGQVDQVGDIFDEILAESSMEETRRRTEDVWKKRLPHPLDEGAVGRLESHILKSAYVLGQRESGHVKEQNYLKEMMTDISHQIKTPLASLQVFLEIFERNLTQEKLQIMVTQAQDQVERIHWLVMGLLKLTQLESGMLPIEKSSNDLGVMLRECAESVITGFPEKQIHIKFQGPGHCSFLCEKEWLTEAFQNLIKNCCEFSPAGGEIMISWTKTQMALTVQIMDRGPGISMEELPKIFNRFYQVKGSKEQHQEHKGVGIGLSLAKEIIERQKGSLVAYSSTEPPTFTRFEAVFMI
ncbi:MAG: hypothetical protein BHW06_09270 [Clostridium sp. 44_14]|nr:MAG: hypothetical protein BHW06_09270 [Clostridium sp. 44_14]